MTWIKLVGTIEHPYDRQMHRLFRNLGADQVLADWWNESGYGPLRVREAHGDPKSPWEFEIGPDDNKVWVTAMLNLEIIDDPNTSRKDAIERARINVVHIMRQVATFLGRTLPPKELPR